MSTSEPDVMCRFCGAWGPPRGFHSCPQMSPNQPQQQAWAQPAPEMRRIAAGIDQLLKENHALVARVEQAERERDEIKDKFDHLHSEWTYERGRGDHLVYRREWEAFNRWQRGAEAQQALLADAIAYVRRNVGTDTPTSIEADLLARYEEEPT